jgi:hypothetical protein
MIPDNPYSTYSEGKGVKECQTYHVRGHYSTTYRQNPNRSKAAENKAKKRCNRRRLGSKKKRSPKSKQRTKQGSGRKK